MYSKGMYLGLQGTRFLVGFLRVLAVVQQKACMHVIGANNIRAGEGLTWRRWQIDCTRLQGWVRAGATSSVVVVFTRIYIYIYIYLYSCVCGPRCSVGDSSRALETSRYTVQQKSTPMKCKTVVVVQALTGRCATGPWIWENVASLFFVTVH